MNAEEKKNENKSEGSEHESDDENEILEESPCGRWLKRSEEVSQRNVPGIDRAYLAMDSEEGVEVVWNEVQFSERKSFNKQEEKIKNLFDNLMKIDHANIVKFHRYWIDYSTSKEQQKTRVVFITEYMSSGSVKEFLNKTKELQSSKRNKSWKRWCTQILSALNYLHSCNPPVIHGNMTCDTIFIQHNGLVKIGSVAPDAIRNHVKTYHEVKHLHYYAPEYEMAQNITPAVDIFSFGICALEMAVPRFHLHHQSKTVTPADIEKAIDLLENPQQKDFIRLCLCEDPKQRPSARSLLLHPLLFEVHSLKLLSAHAFVKNQGILPEYKPKEQNKDVEIAKTVHNAIKKKDIPVFDVDKFLEDVLNGVYPLTSYALPQPTWVPTETAPKQSEGQTVEGHKPSGTPDEIVPETRKIIFAQGTLIPMEKSHDLTLQLRFEDKMNRHLNCEMTTDDSAEILATELMEHKFIRESDKDMIKQLLEDLIKSQQSNKGSVHLSCGHYYGSEQSFNVANDLATALKPITGDPTTEQGNYVLYQNMSQILPKPHFLNGGQEDQSVTNGNMTTAYQQVLTQNNIPVPALLPANPAIFTTAQHVAPFVGAQVIHSIPQHSAVMPNQADSILSTTNNLAKQLSANQTPAVVPLSLPLQYIPILQPQAAQPTVSTPSQVPNAVPYQTQFVSQQVLHQLQPIYAHQLQNSAMPSVLTPLNPNLQQPVLTQNLVPGMVAQSLVSATAVPQSRQQGRIAEQRNGSVYTPGQPIQSNNSNNTSFSRSTSRVDETNSAFTPVATNGNDIDANAFNAPPPTPTGSESLFKIG